MREILFGIQCVAYHVFFSKKCGISRIFDNSLIAFLNAFYLNYMKIIVITKLVYFWLIKHRKQHVF